MPLRFPGQYHDTETGLFYNLHCYYNPDTGRYITADPLGLAPSPNPHTYVTNPTTAIDPLGLSAETHGLHDGDAAKVVRVSAGEGLERAPGALVRNVGPHENMSALCDELCSLTYASGREHALVSTSSGFQIHAGGATGIDLSSDVTQVLARTHPYHLPALGPSADDVAMLGQLGQSTSILLEHGQTILFGCGGTIAWR